MDLAELKRLREEKLLEHKRKKRAYYLKSKMQKKQARAQKVASSIDYEVELFGGNFADKLKEIAKKQMLHVQSREEIIKNKIDEYRKKKKQYYHQHKKSRLEYDKEYRDKKKEQLKQYRKEYYQKNKEKILAQQKANRKKKKLEKEKNGN